MSGKLPEKVTPPIRRGAPTKPPVEGDSRKLKAITGRLRDSQRSRVGSDQPWPILLSSPAKAVCTELVERLDYLGRECARQTIQGENELSDYREDLGLDLVRTLQQLSDFFFKVEDNVNGHAEDWHDFSVKEHSRNFGRKVKHWSELKSIFDIKELSPSFLHLPHDPALRKYFLGKIDGMRKVDLMAIGGIVHDIGKYVPNKKGRSLYTRHEARSLILIEDERSPVNELLTGKGLTPRQIAYIAKLGELHFELGKLRAVVGRQRYNREYAFSVDFKIDLLNLLKEGDNFEYRRELVLMFLFDSLSKLKERPEILRKYDPEAADETRVKVYQKMPEDESLEDQLLKQWVGRHKSQDEVSIRGYKALDVNIPISLRALGIIGYLRDKDAPNLDTIIDYIRRDNSLSVKEIVKSFR